jgi:RHS repeat-associated protein
MKRLMLPVQKKTSKIDWTYDTAGRLIREVFDHYDDTLDQTQEWEYDLVGNRTLQRLDKGNDGFDTITSYTYDVNDWLLEEILDDLTAANKDRITEYRYDHTQQTYKSVSENGVKLNETTFEYNAQGRMAIVTITTFAEDGTKTRIERTSYDYSTNGIRVSSLYEIDADADEKFETSKLTEYLNDSLNITGYSQVIKQTETDLETGKQSNITYIIGRNKIAQITVKNGTEQEYYFTFDGHGSSKVLTDLAGAIVELYAFDAYGNAIGFDPSTALTEFLYSGEQFDSKIGQQYLRQRYYDPVTGRFNRLDPFFGNLNDPQSLHKYLYCHADPITMIDLNGEFGMATVSMALAIGGALGGTIMGAYRGYAETGTIFSVKTIGYAVLGGLVGFSIGSAMGAMISYIAGASGGFNAMTVFFTSIKMAPKLLQQISKIVTQGSLGSQGSAALLAFGGGIIAGIVFALTEPDTIEEPLSIAALTTLGVSGSGDVGWRVIMKHACGIKHHTVPPAFQVFQVFTWGFNLGYFGTNWIDDAANYAFDTYDYFLTE